MNEKGYIAGKLFKKGDQNQRILEKKLLSESIPSVEWFNPLTDNQANDKSKLPEANDVFEGDTTKIIESKYIVAELDDEDSGTMMELGIAYGLNFMLGSIDFLMNEIGLSSEDAIKALKDYIPEKHVFAHQTDIRLGTAGAYRERYIPVGFNQYVVGGVEQMGKIYSDFDALLLDLKLQSEGLIENDER